MNEYIESLKLSGLADATIRSYKKDLTKLYTHFGVESYSDFKNISVAQVKEFYTKQDLKPNSLNALIRNLSAFFNWMLDNDYVVESETPFFKVKFGRSKFVKVKKQKKVILTKEESNKLIEAGRTKQERFMLALMLHTAIRRSEVTNILMTDIEDNRILIREEKGGEQHYTFLNEELKNVMDDYVNTERFTDSPYLFYSTRGGRADGGKLSEQSVYNRVKDCAKLSGISEDRVAGLSPHRLRGTRITEVALTHGMKQAQALGRHKNIGTTEIYVQLSDAVVEALLT
jgi:integrase/recombinase XerD